jgi:hypothetical protein
MLQILGGAVQFVAGAASAVPNGQARAAAEMDPLVQGAHKALIVYSRASDAYAANQLSPSVAFWALLLAAGVVLLEWLVAGRRGRP